jgi:lysophospholipase L1-like esterase
VASAFARRFVFPALLVAGSALFCVVALEAVLRIAGYPHQPARLSCYDPIIGNVYCASFEAYPDNMYDSRIVVRINSEGMADREYRRAKPAGTLRIALLGDSVTASVDVRPADKFKALWEDALTVRLGRPTEILNFAVEGAGTWDQLQLFHLRARHFQPDYVLLGFFWGNDVWNNGSLLRNGRPNPLADEYPAATVLTDLKVAHRRLSRWLWNRTYAYQFVRRLLTRADTIANYEGAVERAKQENGAPATQRDVVYDPAFAWDSSDWELTRRLILKLKAESEAAGARLVVFHIPMLAQLGLPRPLPYREFREFLAANGIASVDAFEALEALSAADRAGLYTRDRVHLSVRGHRFFATTTASQLLEAIQGR